MVRTQIYLTEEEKERLRAIAGRRGRTQSDLIREAIDRFLRQFHEGDRLELLRAARGLWRTRKGLPNFRRLRREWDRATRG